MRKEGRERGREGVRGRGRGWKIKIHTQPRLSSDMHTIYPPFFSYSSKKKNG
jgi:hypothetical protein